MRVVAKNVEQNTFMFSKAVFDVCPPMQTITKNKMMLEFSFFFPSHDCKHLYINAYITGLLTCVRSMHVPVHSIKTRLSD